MEIGQILKETRMSKQKTLDDIQEMTKIQKRYLHAIEENNFQALPGRFYARAFIKEYALVLDLEPDVLLQHFDEEDIQPKESVQYTSLKRTRRTREPKGSGFLSFLPTVIVVFLIIAILFVAWTLTQKALSTNQTNKNSNPESDEIIRNVDEPSKNIEPDDEEETGEGADDNVPPEEENEQGIQEGKFTLVEEGTGSSPQSTLDFDYAQEGIQLTFEVTADSYVAMTGSSGKKYFDGIVSPQSSGEVYDLNEEENIFLNIGNAAGLIVKVNDVELAYPVDPASRVHQKLLINFKKQ